MVFFCLYHLLTQVHLLYLCRHDETKKAYVSLTLDYDVLDVTNKIGIIKAGIVFAYWYEEIFTVIILLGENELC